MADGEVDFYNVLGVQRSCTPQDINAAYRAKALQWHPDKFANKSTMEQGFAEQMMRALNQARSVLSNPGLRRDYDNNDYDPNDNNYDDEYDSYDGKYSEAEEEQEQEVTPTPHVPAQDPRDAVLQEMHEAHKLFNRFGVKEHTTMNTEVPLYVFDMLRRLLERPEQHRDMGLFAELNEKLFYALFYDPGYYDDPFEDGHMTKREFVCCYLSKLYLVKVGSMIWIRNFSFLSPADPQTRNFSKQKLSEFKRDVMADCMVKDKQNFPTWALRNGCIMKKKSADMQAASKDNLSIFAGLPYDGKHLVRFNDNSPLNEFLDEHAQTIDREALLTWLHKTVQANLQQGHPEHHGMNGDALSQLLCLVYNVNAQSETDVDYHLSKRKWKWLDHPFEKTKVLDLYMGDQQCGKTMLLIEWEGKVMLGGAAGYYAPTSMKLLIKGGGTCGENAIEQNRLLLACDEEGGYGGIKTTSKDWQKVRDRITQIEQQTKSSGNNRSIGSDVADIICITNDVHAYKNAFRGGFEARVRPIYTDNGNAADGARADTTRQSFLDPIALTIFADKCDYLAPAQKTSEHMQQLRDARVACAHEYAFLLRCWKNDAFRPQDFPRPELNITEAAQFQLSALQKFMIALCRQPVRGITDLAGMQKASMDDVVTRFKLFMETSSAVCVHKKGQDLDQYNRVKRKPLSVSVGYFTKEIVSTEMGTKGDSTSLRNQVFHLKNKSKPREIDVPPCSELERILRDCGYIPEQYWEDEDFVSSIMEEYFCIDYEEEHINDDPMDVGDIEVDVADYQRMYHLCLNSFVLANVPIRRCSIRMSAKKIADKLGRGGEMPRLVAVKVPVGMDRVCQQLPEAQAERTLAKWREVVGEAKAHFRAESSPDDMDPAYRAHKDCSTSSLESSSGLPALHAALGDADALEVVSSRGSRPFVYTDEEWAAVLAYAPDWSKSEQELAREFKGAPLHLKGTLYKLVHVVRTCKDALGEYSTRKGPFLEMSERIVAAVAFLYSSDCRTDVAKAIAHTHSQSELLVTELLKGQPLQPVHTERLEEIKNMHSGDEACGRCEFQKLYSKLTADHVSAMEWSIQTGQGIQWRYDYGEWKGSVRDSERDGVFWNGLIAADALVGVWKAAARVAPAPAPAVAPAPAPAPAPAAPTVDELQRQLAELRAQVSSSRAEANKIVIDAMYIYGEYTGEADEFARPHGEGTVVCLPHKDKVYEGQWRNGVLHGAGTMKSEYSTYVGQWSHGKQSGRGVFQTNGTVLYKYEGQFFNGKMHGNGTCYQSDETYTGQFENGVRHGSGRVVPKDSSKREMIVRYENGNLVPLGQLSLAQMEKQS